MLDAIFGSATRVKIINLFLLYPEKRYRLTTLARDLVVPAGGLRHEIDNLVKFGLVIEERAAPEAGKKKKGEFKVYGINTNFILYPEIKALFAKAQILFSQKFILGLQKICQPKLLALTGVFTNYPEAQTDLLIVGSIRKTAFLKLIKGLEKDLGREINYTILNEKEFRYRREIMDIFLYNILDGKTLILINNFK